MKLRVYSVYDNMTEEYKYPIILPNDKIAIFYFKKEMVKCDEEIRISSQLVHIGYFDTQSAKIEPVDVLNVVFTGVDCGKEDKSNNA